MKKYKVGDIVYIEWDDHCTHENSWINTSSVSHNICMVKTVGFVVRDGNYAITVSLMMQDPNDVVSQCITIVKACIQKIRKIK